MPGRKEKEPDPDKTVPVSPESDDPMDSLPLPIDPLPALAKRIFNLAAEKPPQPPSDEEQQ